MEILLRIRKYILFSLVDILNNAYWNSMILIMAVV